MKPLHFSHLDREQSGDVGFIIKNLIFLGVFPYWVGSIPSIFYGLACWN